MGFLMPPKAPALPAPPPAAPAFGAQVQAPKPVKKPMQPTFLGAEKTPTSDLGAGGMERGKTLLGQ